MKSWWTWLLVTFSYLRRIIISIFYFRFFMNPTQKSQFSFLHMLWPFEYVKANGAKSKVIHRVWFYNKIRTPNEYESFHYHNEQFKLILKALNILFNLNNIKFSIFASNLKRSCPLQLHEKQFLYRSKYLR